MKRLILWVPLLIFVVFVAAVALRLHAPGDNLIRSQLVGKPLPVFALPAAIDGRTSIQSQDYSTGQPRILNVFASWCVPCIAEAPQLLELKRRGIPIDAIAVRDRPEDIATFLAKWGDPYANIGADIDSRVQFSLGSSGVPESFVIDGNGMVRHQHIGDVKAEDIPTLLAAYEAAR
ncbi:MAG: redoxin family protein [Pseudomonadota bacterium]|nr:redoxin family protein [Pseudomonadota bacterium]